MKPMRDFYSRLVRPLPRNRRVGEPAQGCGCGKDHRTFFCDACGGDLLAYGHEPGCWTQRNHDGRRFTKSYVNAGCAENSWCDLFDGHDGRCGVGIDHELTVAKKPGFRHLAPTKPKGQE